MNLVNGAGQGVRDTRTGAIGITTDEPRKRSPSIGVMFIGSNYSVLAPLDTLERVTLTALEPENL